MRTFGRVTTALNCQLLMIGTRRALTIEEISQCVDQPTTDPRSETVKAQWLQSPGTDQLVHLCAQLSALVGSAQVVVYRDPHWRPHQKRTAQSAVRRRSAAPLRSCSDRKNSHLSK